MFAAARKISKQRGTPNSNALKGSKNAPFNTLKGKMAGLVLMVHPKIDTWFLKEGGSFQEYVVYEYTL